MIISLDIKKTDKMNSFFTLLTCILLGLIGGLCGYKLKIPAGSLIGSMVFVIAFKLILKTEWVPPKQFGIGIQIALGVVVGTTFQPSLLSTFYKMLLPIVISSIVLVATGILTAFIFHKTGLLDINTGYLGTSPGAMSILIVLAMENQISATVITCFHLFRVIFVIITAPLLMKLIT